MLTTLCGDAGVNLVEVTLPCGGCKAHRLIPRQALESAGENVRQEARGADKGGDATLSEGKAQASIPESAPEEGVQERDCALSRGLRDLQPGKPRGSAVSPDREREALACKAL